MRSWYGTSATQRTPAIRWRVTASRQRFSTARMESGSGQARPTDAVACSRLRLVQVGLFKEVVAVARVHGEVDQRRFAQDLEGNERAGGTEAPDAPPKVGKPGGLRAGHLDHDV